jgi:hypothetical protein
VKSEALVEKEAEWHRGILGITVVKRGMESIKHSIIL